MGREDDKVIVYQDAAAEWRWHRRAANNELVSNSGEGYVSKERAIEMATTLNPDATLDVRDPE